VRKFIFAGFVLALALGGCATPPISRATLDEIKVSRSSRAEVHKALGKPTSPGENTEVWEFKLPNGKIGNVEISYQNNVVVDKQGRNLPDGEKPPAKKED